MAAAVERRLIGESVRRCLTSLSSAQRAAIVTAYFGGLTYRETAAQLGATLSAVKTRIRDGLGRLHGCLGMTRD